MKMLCHEPTEQMVKAARGFAANWIARNAMRAAAAVAAFGLCAAMAAPQDPQPGAAPGKALHAPAGTVKGAKAKADDPAKPQAAKPDAAKSETGKPEPGSLFPPGKLVLRLRSRSFRWSSRKSSGNIPPRARWRCATSTSYDGAATLVIEKPDGNAR